MLRFLRIRSAARPRFGFELIEHGVARMHQAKADVLHGDAAEAAQAFVQHLRQFAGRLDPGEAAAGDHEGQQRLLLGRVLLDVGKLETAEDMVSEPVRVAEVLQRQRVFADARHGGEVADLAEPEDELVIGNFGQGAALALRDQDDLPPRVDAVDLAPAEVRLGDDVADRVDDVGRADAPGRHFGQERLEDEIVLLREELDMHVLARAEHPGQMLGGVDAGKAAAEDDDAMRGSRAGPRADTSLGLRRGGGYVGHSIIPMERARSELRDGGP